MVINSIFISSSGPVIDSFFALKCVVGIDCIIEIPGNYINTKNCYYMSTSANDPVFEKLLKVSEGKYLYYMDKDKHITDVKSEQENVIYWSPDCKYEKFKVCLGYIKVLSKILIMI